MHSGNFLTFRTHTSIGWEKNEQRQFKYEMKWNEMKDAWHTERGNWIDRKCLIWTFKGQIIDRESESSNYAHEFRNLSVTSFETNNNKNTINRPMLSNFSNKQ